MSKVNSHHLAIALVDHVIGQMTITNAQYVLTDAVQGM